MSPETTPSTQTRAENVITDTPLDNSAGIKENQKNSKKDKWKHQKHWKKENKKSDKITKTSQEKEEINNAEKKESEKTQKKKDTKEPVLLETAHDLLDAPKHAISPAHNLLGKEPKSDKITNSIHQNN